jgi:myb proto-oncogene protein
MWKDIAPRLPGRVGESVRGRYVNHLDPSLKKSKWTKKEDDVLFENQRKLGNKWSEIRKLLPGRSDNSIKNRYHNRKTAYFRKIQKLKEKKNRNNFVEASAKTVKEKFVGSVNFLNARPAPLSLEDFPDAVFGI